MARSKDEPREPEIATTVRLSQEEHAFVKRVAERDLRSLNAQFRHWVHEAKRREEEAA